MAFVFYDVETTGLHKRYDQILTFAAILTDEDLVERDRFTCECRLLPQIVPHPVALLHNGLTLEQISSQTLPSHYEMMCAIARRLETWGDTLYIGYNSIAFDEELLRQALYLSLHNPYLTSRIGCGRADVLTLARTVAFLSPGALTVPLAADGQRSFRLEDITAANGITHDAAHSAIADAAAALDLCRIARDRDGETWSRFLRMSTKSAVIALLEAEDAVLHIGFRGNDAVPQLVTAIATDQNKRFCLPLAFDVARFEGLDDGAAWSWLNCAEGGLVVVEVNKCPILAPFYEAPEDFVGMPDAEDRAAALRANQPLATRLALLVQQNRPDFSTHRELEDRLYEKLPFNQDDPIKRAFHSADWSERVRLAALLKDPRARAAALRIIHEARPDLLAPEDAFRVANGVRRRWAEEPGRRAWRTLSAAIEALDEIPLEVRQSLESEFLALHDRMAMG